jgi:DNA replication and repair protein RecF
MRVTDFIIKNFRNYSEAKLKFSEEINFITGENGSGKTNILEALSILSNIRSFRNIGDSSIIKKGETSYYCSAVLSESVYLKFETGCTTSNGKIIKKIKIDGGEIHKVRDYYGRFLTVIFSPGDINIITGSPELRRRFLDSVISKTDPEYIETLSEFKKILISRNALLRKIKSGGSSDYKNLEVWDMVFAEKACKIIKKRENFVNAFSGKFSISYKMISDTDETPDLFYQSLLKDKSSDDIYNLMVQNRNKDIRLGSTATGPQRDDYLIAYKNKESFNNFASQGQKRTASIAIKIAEFETVEEKTGEKCVILVDDIFSELDSSRRNNMVNVLSGGNQVIFTMVNTDFITADSFREASRFMVFPEGRIEQQ